MRILFALISIISFLTACDKDKEYDKSKAISAFAAIDPIRVDPTLEKIVVTIPTQQKNNFWSGSASARNQQIENFEKKFSESESGIFRKTREISLDESSIAWFFYSGKSSDHFVFSPIIHDGKIFILDAAGTLVAKDLSSEKKIWKSQVFEKKILKNYKTPRIGYGDGKIIASVGVNKIAAVSEADGSVIWSKSISSIPVANPVCDEKFAYILSSDNKLYAFDLNSGELQWMHSGINRATTIFGAADPVIYKDLLIVAYSSGEIYSLKKSTGETLWSYDLNYNKATSSDFYLNDVDATPLVQNGIVYAIGNGGLMMAIDAKSSKIIWRKRIAGIVDFWGAGEFLYLINNDNKLLALSKKSGGIKWISQLPHFEKEKKPQTKFIYSGVIMAGDKLVISRLDGELLIASPLDGKIEKTFSIGKKITHAPVAIDGKIYLHTIGTWTTDLIEIQ